MIMPLLPCPDCGKEFSSIAIACPNCGRPRMGSRSIKRLPRTRKGYLFNSLIGFFFLCLLWVISIQVFAGVLGFNPEQVIHFVLGLSLVVYIIDNINFQPPQIDAPDTHISNFSYFVTGTYTRVARSFKNGQRKYVIALFSLLVVLVLVGIMGLPDHLKAIAFLKNSDIVVKQSEPVLQVMKQCKALEDCPQDFEKLAKIIHSYAIPEPSYGFVRIISYDDATYKAISSSSDARFTMRAQPLPPPGSKKEIEIEIFRPMFNKDFEQLVNTFQEPHQSSIELARLASSSWSSDSFMRSLHYVKNNGHPLVVYIVSNVDYSWTPAQQKRMSQ